MELDKIETQNLLEEVHQFLKERNHEKALYYVNKLLDKNPTNEKAWLYLGITYRRLGKLEDAIKCFDTAADLDNSMVEAWGLLTITYMDKGEIDLAKRTMDKAADLNPKDEKILFYRNNLIRVYDKFGPFF
jgi:tetratricopeptide (TPR) repeat protein